MKYFTKEEAARIIADGPMGLCYNDPDNPNIEAARALHEATKRLHNSPVTAAAVGFVLGRATGIREERARRKGATA